MSSNDDKPVQANTPDGSLLQTGDTQAEAPVASATTDVSTDTIVNPSMKANPPLFYINTEHKVEETSSVTTIVGDRVDNCQQKRRRCPSIYSFDACYQGNKQVYGESPPLRRSERNHRKLKALRPATFKYHTKYAPYPSHSFIDRFESLSMSDLAEEDRGDQDCCAKRLRRSVGAITPSSGVVFGRTDDQRETTELDDHEDQTATTDNNNAFKALASTIQCKSSSSSHGKKLDGPLFSLSSRETSSAQQRAKMVCKNGGVGKKCRSKSEDLTSSRCSHGVGNELLLATTATDHRKPSDTAPDDDVAFLSGYMEDYFHLPKQMSSMAEMMYA